MADFSITFQQGQGQAPSPTVRPLEIHDPSKMGVPPAQI